MTLTFDPRLHAYAIGERRLPSVTGVLRLAGHLDDLAWFGTPEALERGRLVHALTHAVDVTGWDDLGTPIPLPAWGVVVPRSLVVLGAGGRLRVGCPEPLRGYVEAYRAVRALYGPRWDRAEEPLASPGGDFAGTPDRMGVFNGAPCVAEIKTGEHAAWHGYQTAGYDLLEPLPFRRRRVGIYLRRDGDFRIRRFEDDEDYACFGRALGDAKAW